MPPPASKLARPTREIFDPFNSSATGHQRAENRLSGSTSWRDSRTLKLNKQFRGPSSASEWTNDTVGAGSLHFGEDGRTATGGWGKGAKGLRAAGQKSIRDMLGGVVKADQQEPERPTKRAKIDLDEPKPKPKPKQKPCIVVNPFTPFRKQDGTIRETSWTSHELSPSHLLSPFDAALASSPDDQKEVDTVEDESVPEECPKIFANLTFYINGSTAPAISDHKLKYMIKAHGGNMSIVLGRRTVTHAIISRPASNGGVGGGLAGSKLQKEIARTRGNVVKYVTVEWVIECVKAGKRLPESRFEAIRFAAKGSGNVSTMLKRATK